MKRVGDARFEFGVDPNDIILLAIERLNNLSSPDAQQVLAEVYETKYGIFNHLDPNNIYRPLGSVAFHPAEDINTDSLLEDLFSVYIKKHIHATFHISLLEFIELPHDIVEMMVRLADEHVNKEKANLDGLMPDK